MELRQLEYLASVIDQGSFTRAAEQLHVSQPAISVQLRKLERELGETLVDRSDRRVRPTEIGEAVLAEARVALAATTSMRTVVAAHTGLLTGRAAVGVIGSGVPPQFPRLLAAFARRHPAVELTLIPDITGSLVRGLGDRSLDVAVLGLTGTVPAGLETLCLLEGPVVLGVAPDHRWARRRSVRVAELTGQVLIVQPEGSGLRAALDLALSSRLAPTERPRMAYQAAEPRVLGELAVQGLGIAVLPRAVVPFVDGLVGVDLVGPSLRSSVELAWPVDRPLSPAGRALVRHLREGLAPETG